MGLFKNMLKKTVEAGQAGNNALAEQLVSSYQSLNEDDQVPDSAAAPDSADSDEDTRGQNAAAGATDDADAAADADSSTATER